MTEVCFIDFELAGEHYRSYDLFKLFRTKRVAVCRDNLRAFLAEYLSCQRQGEAHEARAERAVQRQGGAAAHGSVDDLELELDELEAETRVAEPLTWLEAAVFFLFAIAEYPAEASTWEPLARQRWESYLESAHILDDDSGAVRALLAARKARKEAAAAAA